MSAYPKAAATRPAARFLFLRCNSEVVNRAVAPTFSTRWSKPILRAGGSTSHQSAKPVAAAPTALRSVHRLMEAAHFWNCGLGLATNISVVADVAWCPFSGFFLGPLSGTMCCARLPTASRPTARSKFVWKKTLCQVGRMQRYYGYGFIIWTSEIIQLIDLFRNLRNMWGEAGLGHVERVPIFFLRLELRRIQLFG
jgi:hypothetical protein